MTEREKICLFTYKLNRNEKKGNLYMQKKQRIKILLKVKKIYEVPFYSIIRFNVTH